jgi:hypothetical protein
MGENYREKRRKKYRAGDAVLSDRVLASMHKVLGLIPNTKKKKL